MIEITFRGIDIVVRKRSDVLEPKVLPDNAIHELNVRFRESEIGFQYESPEIIRVDSQHIHSNVVKPTLALLKSKIYKGANEEFLSAYVHYRYKRYKESLNECLKSFESVLKSICEKRKWDYEKTDTAKKLINIVISSGILPSFLESQMNSIKSLMESGIPTIRNKLSGHGQGTDAIDVPEYIVSYMLHLTATTILFLIQAEQNLS